MPETVIGYTYISPKGIIKTTFTIDGYEVKRIEQDLKGNFISMELLTRPLFEELIMHTSPSIEEAMIAYIQAKSAYIHSCNKYLQEDMKSLLNNCYRLTVAMKDYCLFKLRKL